MTECRRRRLILVHLTTIATVITFNSLSACATPQTYLGIPMRGPGSSPEIQMLSARASRGDKRAQYDLGLLFETGDGVPKSRTKAINLYRKAASDSGGTTWIYSSPLGKGTKGRVVSRQQGSRQVGLRAAKLRLDTLRAEDGDNANLER
jgi:hypothetical protein